MGTTAGLTLDHSRGNLGRIYPGIERVMIPPGSQACCDRDQTSGLTRARHRLCHLDNTASSPVTALYSYKGPQRGTLSFSAIQNEQIEQSYSSTSYIPGMGHMSAGSVLMVCSLPPLFPAKPGRGCCGRSQKMRAQLDEHSWEGVALGPEVQGRGLEAGEKRRRSWRWGRRRRKKRRKKRRKRRS